MAVAHLDHDGVPFCLTGGCTLVPMSGFVERAHELARMIHEKSKRYGQLETPVDVAVPEFKLRPSGEPYVELGKKHIGGHDVFVLTSGPGTYEMTGQLTYLLGYLAGRKARRITVITGYLPQGRSDKDEHKVFALPPILVKAWLAVADGKLERIVCADPHSDQSTMVGKTGLITPVWLTYRLLKRVVDEALQVNEKVVLAFPDASARKRFKKALKQLWKDLGHELPVIYASADRIDANVKNIDGMSGDLSALEDALVIQLDDESASGGTQIKAALQIKAAGAMDVWAAVTHGVLCGDASDRFSADDCPISRVYITDTIPPENRADLVAMLANGILFVVTWTEDLGWVIYNAHWDDDIRETRGIENPED